MGGYKTLLIYRTAVTISDLTAIFCERYINKKSRTYDQMIQAARSGKQNLSEGSKELSSGGEILLSSTGRSSYTELIEDFEDFLRQKGLPVWQKDDPRVLRIRAFRENVEVPTNLTNLANWTNLDFENPESFANLMICLCYKQGYLMDQFLRAKQEKFVKEGGFKENLYKKRQEYKNKSKK
ncbi:four helix bundle protein [Candidatus Gottesmanbacteria bacterium]|nr:four helix bundle protein [Candidatus Gottesmanbacteria bacterium]